MSATTSNAASNAASVAKSFTAAVAAEDGHNAHVYYDDEQYDEAQHDDEQYDEAQHDEEQHDEEQHDEEEVLDDEEQHEATPHSRAIAHMKKLARRSAKNPAEAAQNYDTLLRMTQGPSEVRVVSYVEKWTDRHGWEHSRVVRYARPLATLPAGALLYYSLWVEQKRGGVLTTQEHARLHELRDKFGPIRKR